MGDGQEAAIQPVTAIGKGLATLMLLLGGCMFGVPVAIVSTGFEDMISEQAGEEKTGPDVYELLKHYDELSDEEKKKFKAYVMAEDD